MKLDGRKVLREREIRALNVPDAAREIGISGNALLNAEHGNDIRPTTAKKIAAGYGLTVADLYPEEAQRSSRLQEVNERFAGYAADLNRYCEAFEKKLESGTSTQQDVDQFVLNLQLAGPAMGRVYQDELRELADALGIAERVGRQVLSGVSKNTVNASIDAQLFEHSVVLPALQRYYAVGHTLAKAAGDRENAETIRRTGRALTGAAA